MATISKATWKELESSVSKGETIPDWYLRFLTPELAMKLVQVAIRANNKRFPDQLKAFILKLHTVHMAPIEKKSLKIKSPTQPVISKQKPRRSQKRAPRFNMNGPLPPRATRPPPAPNPWQNIFCYIGGSGSLPVQNDKSANLPHEI